MATAVKTAFEIRGADGGPLRGDVRSAQGGQGRRAVVICHGFKGFKDWGFFPRLAGRLARAGMTAVSFNFSGSGVGPDGESFTEPERFARDTYTKAIDDLGRVCDKLTSGDLVRGVVPPTKVGLFGHSRGGAVALLRATADETVAALVTWAAVSRGLRWPNETIESWRASGKLDIVNARTGDVLPLYTDVLEELERHGNGRLDFLAAARKVRAPWLIVHGNEDEAVLVSEAEALAAAAGEGIAKLEMIEGGGHTFGARHPWAGSTAQLDEAMDVTADWFSRNLLA